MVICFLLGGFYSGGIARVTSVLANNLCKLDENQIHVISYLKKDQNFVYQLDNNVHKHYLFEEPTSMKNAIIKKGAIKKIRQIIIDNKIDILICCDAIFFPLGVLSCRRTSALCYCWEHTSPYIVSDHKYQNLCRSFGLKHCFKYIVLTKDAETFYKKKYPRHAKKVFQIYNPIDEECKCSGEYNVSSKKILSVGRLTYPKKFDRLIRVAEQVLPNYPDWCWDIYGEGELMDSLKEQILRCNAPNQIFLKGKILIYIISILTIRS